MNNENLAPIKIFLNFFSENSSEIARKFSNIYKIKIIDVRDFLKQMMI